MLIGYILPDSWDPPKIQESTGLLKNTTDIFGDELAYFKEVFFSTWLTPYHIWLVVWNMFLYFHIPSGYST